MLIVISDIGLAERHVLSDMDFAATTTPAMTRRMTEHKKERKGGKETGYYYAYIEQYI